LPQRIQHPPWVAANWAMSLSRRSHLMSGWRLTTPEAGTGRIRAKCARTVRRPTTPPRMRSRRRGRRAKSRGAPRLSLMRGTRAGSLSSARERRNRQVPGYARSCRQARRRRRARACPAHVEKRSGELCACVLHRYLARSKPGSGFYWHGPLEQDRLRSYEFTGEAALAQLWPDTARPLGGAGLTRKVIGGCSCRHSERLPVLRPGARTRSIHTAGRNRCALSESQRAMRRVRLAQIIRSTALASPWPRLEARHRAHRLIHGWCGCCAAARAQLVQRGEQQGYKAGFDRLAQQLGEDGIEQAQVAQRAGRPDPARPHPGWSPPPGGGARVRQLRPARTCAMRRRAAYSASSRLADLDKGNRRPAAVQWRSGDGPTPSYTGWTRRYRLDGSAIARRRATRIFGCGGSADTGSACLSLRAMIIICRPSPMLLGRQQGRPLA